MYSSGTIYDSLGFEDCHFVTHLLNLVSDIKNLISEIKVTDEVYTWRGFVKCFLRVPQAIGLYRSCRAAQARGNFRKHSTTKPFIQVAAQGCTEVSPIKCDVRECIVKTSDSRECVVGDSKQDDAK